MAGENLWFAALFTALMCGLAFDLLMPQCVSWLILNNLCVLILLVPNFVLIMLIKPAKTGFLSQGRKREEPGSKIELMAALKKMTSFFFFHTTSSSHFVDHKVNNFEQAIHSPSFIVRAFNTLEVINSDSNPTPPLRVRNSPPPPKKKAQPN